MSELDWEPEPPPLPVCCPHCGERLSTVRRVEVARVVLLKKCCRCLRYEREVDAASRTHAQ